MVLTVRVLGTHSEGVWYSRDEEGVAVEARLGHLGAGRRGRVRAELELHVAEVVGGEVEEGLDALSLHEARLGRDEAAVISASHLVGTRTRSNTVNV